ncbi:MAG: relaxase domain-containing protein, partial [Acaryochloris sp. RU_4_1]|nr:relaxase domain-containing protein [Acaryochloris sp. RU_4_1]
MLDIITIHSDIEDGEKYYTEEENYYSEDEEIQAITKSQWFGNLAPDQPYSAELFTQLFYGELPNGQRMRKEVMGDGVERVGYDLTFTLPGKSLSMQIHGPNGDKRLWHAHIEAVKEVMAIVEQRYAAARVQVAGDRQIVKTGNIAACLVNHHESRAGDPHVHTHVVLFNGTQCPDGEYRALYKELLSQSGVLGDIYHQKLALKVQALGYEIEETAEGFELAGVTKEQIQHFSKRSTEIEDYIKEQGWSNTPNSRRKAVIATRLAKDKSLSLEQKQDRWSREMQAVGFGGIIPADHPIAPKNQETPRELLDAAIGHLSERQSSFDREDIQRFVFSHLRSFDEGPLNEEIDKHPDLLTAWDGRFTTQTAVDRDIRIIENWLKGNDSVAPLNPNADFSDTKLNSGQAEAMRRLLSSTDQFQILKGLAGTGKTTAMAIAKEQ